MPDVLVNGKPFYAPMGEPLTAVLARLGIPTDHPCGGRGTCKKCTVLVNGKPELACQYIIREHVSVEVDIPPTIHVPALEPCPTVEPWVHLPVEHTALVLDIGTTTMTLYATDTRTGQLVWGSSANNPQRAFGADVMSRIAYAAEHGTEPLTSVLRAEVQRLIDRVSSHCQLPPVTLYAAGNTTMLHLFLGVDPTPMGAAPYSPAFLEEKHLAPDACGLRGVTSVTTLPGISAFVGADLVAGLHHVGLPASPDRWRLLIDLGTNAEILLYNHEKILCTAAAAGPCFEGACISSGMSASRGAICFYDLDGTCGTIEDVPPEGICGTGLVDAVAVLLERGIIDETGYMEPPVFYLCEGVSLIQEDIRQYQLAKSAIHAAIEALVRRAGIAWEDIEQMSIAGGFACLINVENAVRTGLLPRELADRCAPETNTALLGTARYAHDGVDLSAYITRAEYVDLAADPYFSERFMEGMMFE